jgi:diaminopimelate epimerase
MIRFAKAHAYGNDFLYVRAADVRDADLVALARAMCHRTLGIGADGLIVYSVTSDLPSAVASAFSRTDAIRISAAMRLFNSDGSRAEVSGNGVRALGAWLGLNITEPGVEIAVTTEAGVKLLSRLERDGTRQLFRAAMGTPKDLRQVALDAGGETLDAIALDMGNPQLVLLGPLPDDERFQRVGAALEWHERFPGGTNVEFVQVERPDRLRIRIWERGCGPTSSSGTGSCASLVAAAAFGGAARDAEVVAPGGGQRVEWVDDGVFLTGWAEVVCEGEWLLPPAT